MIKKTNYIKISRQEYKKLLLNNFRARFDKFIVILGAVNILATVPQIVQIWSSQDSSGVSLIAWSYYVFYTSVLLGYAITIKSKPMTFMYTGNAIVYISVLGSALIFR